LCNRSAIAQLWRRNGNIKDLPGDLWAWELCDKPVSHMTSVDRSSLSRGGAMAAVFGADDPWVAATTGERPADPIFWSRNGQYWALPWFLREELIGIWVVDMAYWMVADQYMDGFPSFVLSDQILRFLAPAFEVMRQNYWCSGAVGKGY
jgi:hypothetical protein